MGYSKQGLQIHLIASLVLILASFSCAIAQLAPFPLPNAKTLKPNAAAVRSQGNARTQADARPLPFFDDFSATPTNDNTAGANLPVDSLWSNTKNKTVWINDGLALNAPSVNVATFDGLDSLFLPYSAQLLVNGMRDSLVSKPILLGEPAVSIAERPTVYLSFFFQWQGNGEAPDASDYLGVEFKNASGEWKQVMAITPRASYSRTEFYDTILQVTGDEYFHDAFQFRFRNYGRLSGPYDTWNVDYVYLNKSRNPDDIDFPDQAVSSALTSLFGKYRSIPYDHFLEAGELARPSFNVANNLNDYTDLTYLSEATFRNYKKKKLIMENYVSNLGGTDTSAINDDGSGIIFPLEKRAVNLEYLPDASDPTQFDPMADSVWIKLKVKLFTGDTFDPKTGGIANDYDLNYLPIDFRVNDTIYTTYQLGTYYAYDDGIAEYAAGLTQAGNRAAVAYDLAITEPDTLTAIDIYVPDYGLASNLTVDFTIYADDGGMPGQPVYTIPSFSVQRKGKNVFQRILIVEPFLVENRFYIGWKAPVGGTLKVGMDYNSSSEGQIYVNTNGSWVVNTDITGSLMIRPVLDEGGLISAVEDLSAVGVYPNPSNGDFNIDEAFDTLSIFNTTGQSVPFNLYPNDTGTRVMLLRPTAGLYILRMTTGNKHRAAKVIVK